MSRLGDIADAVVTALNAGSWSQTFTATRVYVPQFDLPDMATLRVTVVGRGVEVARSTRQGHQYDYRVDVAVQKKLAGDTNAERDALLTLAEEIADHFRELDAPLTFDSSEAECVAAGYDVVYDPEHLTDLRQLTSVVTLTMRYWSAS